MGNYPPPPSIPGMKAEGELLHLLRSEVANLLSRDSLRFPGAQPVSFARPHLEELQQQDYYVCEKSDGIRCLMYLTEDTVDGERKEVVYLIDRKNDYYWVQGLHFPLPESKVDFHTGTLVDGELVNDRESSGETQMKYLVFDCLALGNVPMINRTLDKRLAYYRAKVIAPYTALYEEYPEEKQYLPFTLDFKSQERAYGIEKIFRTILPNLQHGNDGLIFTCRSTPYKFGTDPNIIKWKPANENSIDFLLLLDVPNYDLDSEDEAEGTTQPYKDYSAMPNFTLAVPIEGREHAAYGNMFVTPEEWENMKALNKPLNEAIVECYQDDQHRWRFMRIREDKHEANHITTVESVIESIEDRIQQEDLIAIDKKIREAWKVREAAEVAAARSGSVTASIAQTTAPNGVNGVHRDTSSGQKRKFGDSMDATETEGANKRQKTPPEASSGA